MTDSDRNGAQDYWTLDVAGFYFLQDAAGESLKYIAVTMARADRLGYPQYAKDGPQSKSGYWLRAMGADEEGHGYCQDADGDGTANTNAGKFAFCAYPAEHGRTGVMTFIVNEEGIIYQKDLGPEGKDGADRWPAEDPTTQEWTETD